jgi:hypothetical protein
MVDLKELIVDKNSIFLVSALTAFILSFLTVSLLPFAPFLIHLILSQLIN